MWILFAFGSAIFAGLTAILSKAGLRNMNSNLATALRTIIVLAFSWLMVFLTDAFQPIAEIDKRTLLYLVLSGLATGGSWLCYFRALQLGDVNKVTPIDKSSTVLTILLAFLFLGETITAVKALGMLLIALGTYRMIQRQHGIQKEHTNQSWMLYALGSAVFASLTAILGKVGIEGVNSTLGTAIRTVVVLIMAWIVAIATGAHRSIGHIDGQNWLFLLLSGLATGASWLCYFRALKDGPASAVVPIDKLSILIAIAFSRIFFKEKLNRRSGVGLGMIVAGTLLMLIE